MNAGRELDALVAEKVMGYDHTAWQVEYPCAYSLNIAYAWQVVNELNPADATKAQLDLFFKFCEYLAELCDADAWNQPSACAIDSLMRNITPERICLAALKAVGYTFFDKPVLDVNIEAPHA